MLRFPNIPLLFTGWLLATTLAAQPGSQPGTLEKESDVSAVSKDQYRRTVKVVSDFFNRFNYNQNPLGERVDKTRLPAQQAAQERQATLETLLDPQNFSLQNSPATVAFLQEVCQADAPRYLDPLQPGWFAEVAFTATYQGQEQRLTLILEKATDPQGAKWAISGVQADFLPKQQEPVGKFIPPNADGTNFISVAQMLNQGQQTADFAAASFRNHEQLQAFLRP